VELVGHKSNRDGIGAEVRVTDVARGSQMVDGVDGGEGICRRTTSARTLDWGRMRWRKLVEIRWPSGVVQKLESVKGDQILKVEEPAK
jgi:hypothetical protein